MTLWNTRQGSQNQKPNTTTFGENDASRNNTQYGNKHFPESHTENNKENNKENEAHRNSHKTARSKEN